MVVLGAETAKHKYAKFWMEIESIQLELLMKQRVGVYTIHLWRVRLEGTFGYIFAVIRG